MNQHRKEIGILFGQLAIFYLLPLATKRLGAIGMVLLLILATFVLAMLMGSGGVGKIKFLYPVFVSAAFVPSVFLYYNESAMVQAVWYLVISLAGVAVGTLFHPNPDK